jgi:hypothetical protein
VNLLKWISYIKYNSPLNLIISLSILHPLCLQRRTLLSEPRQSKISKTSGDTEMKPHSATLVTAGYAAANNTRRIRHAKSLGRRKVGWNKRRWIMVKMDNNTRNIGGQDKVMKFPEGIEVDPSTDASTNPHTHTENRKFCSWKWPYYAAESRDWIRLFIYSSGSQTVCRDTLVCREGPRGVSRN